MEKRQEWPSEFSELETVNLGTSHLPAEVVKQEVVIGVWSTTSKDNPRRGLASVGIRIDGRENPELTADEVEYLEALLDYAKGKIRSKHHD